ncbi:MAG: hypothetical protein D6711_06075 [Chloroflexi bacterium]|nr:MAG: hypothetical protein D6711_06075 [Chloroflexota bacterium]
MPRIIDVIEHPNVARDELVYRLPQDGQGDFRMGSQLIVSEGQAAVFVRGGKALDTFGPGRHTLSTANLPILSGLIGLATSGRTPFTAYVYYVNLRDMPQVPWGTSKPIIIKTPNTGLGVALLRTHGVMEISISDPGLFVMKYAINERMMRLSDIKDRIQTLLLGEISSLLLKSGAQDIMEANVILEEIEGAMLAKVNEKFAEFGMQIKAFEANPFDSMNVSTEELRDYVPRDVWLEVLERQKRLDIGMAAAQNEGAGGGLAAAGIGFGVGQNLGGMMGGNQSNEQLAQMQAQMQQQQMMMQQMMMQMMQQNQQTNQPPAQPAAPVSNPQTKEEIQALIDSLDMKLAMGEISEEIYNKLVAKWQAKLDSM